MRICGQLLLVDKQKVPYLYKTSKEFEFFYKSYATAVAMAIMTFQDGGYFGLVISLSTINYFDNLKKILWSRNFLNYEKVIIHNNFFLATQNLF
jgi:hypothetical protein